MADDRHEGELRRQRHADHVAVINRLAELGERRIAHAHVHAKRQLRAREFIPDRQKTRIGKQPFAGGAEHHSRARTQALHFLYTLQRPDADRARAGGPTI